MPFTHRPARARVTRGPWRIVPWLGVLAALLFLLPTFAAATQAAPSASGAALVPSGPAANVTCNPNYVGASAVDIAAKNPGHAVAGAKLNVTVEFQVAPFRARDRGVVLSFPTLMAVFPYLATGSLQLIFPPKQFVVNGSGWSSPSLRTDSYTVPNATSFAFGSSYLSSAKIAVMATTLTGSLTLQVRWHWTLYNPKSGVTKVGAWTLPRKPPTGAYLPATFYPASYVGLVSTSGLAAPTGTTLNITLNGTVQNTYFRIVLEYPNNGTNIQSIYEYTPTNATTFNATMPLTFPNGTPVPVGKYLVHVHDSCNAITHILQISAT